MRRAAIAIGDTIRRIAEPRQRTATPGYGAGVQPFGIAQGDFDWWGLETQGELTEDGADFNLAGYYAGLETEGLWRGLEPGASWGDWYGAWTCRALLAVNPAYVSSALTGFPLYVNEAVLPAAWFAEALANGNDVLFTDLAGNKLAHDLPHFAPATPACEAHVLHTLTAAPPMLLWAYCGNAAAADQRNAAGVWAADHVVVYHLGEATGNYADSTGHGYTGTRQVSPGGKVGKLFATGGETLDSGDYIDTSRFADLALGVGGIPGAAISCWLKRDTISLARNLLSLTFAGGTTKLVWTLNATDKMALSARGAATDSTRTGTTTDSLTDTADWHHLVAAADIANDLMKFYVDGTPWAYTGATTWTATEFAAAAGDATNSLRAAGVLDEYRIRASVPSAAQVATEYANQNDPASFVKCLALQMR